jgi:hypothetical protein
MTETRMHRQHSQGSSGFALTVSEPRTSAELTDQELAQICAGGGSKGGGRTSVVNRFNIVNRNINNVRVNVRR